MVAVLRDGTAVDIEVLDRKGRVACPDLERVRDFISQPQSPWFSDIEKTLLDRSVSSDEFAGIGSIYLFLARLRGEPIGSVWYQVAEDSTEVGACAFVITHPAHRGLGIAHELMGCSISHFRERGGLAMYLGTSNPVAREVYRRVGFRVYNGVVMRQTGAELDDGRFDKDFFAYAGPGRTRPAAWGDLARLAALYALPHPWFIKDHGIGLYSHPTLPMQRAVSVPISLLLRAEQHSNRLLVMENPRGRVVGAMSVYESAPPEPTAVLDFLVCPSYTQELPSFLEEGIDIGRAAGGERVEAFASELDVEKKAALLKLGFEPVRSLEPPKEVQVPVTMQVYRAPA